MSGDAIFQSRELLRKQPISIPVPGRNREKDFYADRSMTERFASSLVDRCSVKNPSRIADRDEEAPRKKKPRRAAEMRVASTTPCVATGAQ